MAMASASSARGLAAGQRFAGQHARDVGFERQRDDFVATPFLSDADADRVGAELSPARTDQHCGRT